MSSFLMTVLLGAWLLPGAWLSGATVGLGVGLVIASGVHLRASRGSGLAATEPSEPSEPSEPAFGRASGHVLAQHGRR